MADTTHHRWQFFQAGGLTQVRLDSTEDLRHLPELDQKLWVALSCPVKGLELDERTLALIDVDKDGRVRAPEIIAALKFCDAHLRNLADLKNEAEALPLAAISDTPGGQAVLKSAREILKNLGRGDATAIGIADVADLTKVFLNSRFNGDGVITPESAADDATRAVVVDILACGGSDPDRSGKPGLNRARLDAFAADARAFSDWIAKSEADAAGILPLGDATGAAVAALKAVRGKIDDFFGRCRLAAFDPRSLALLNRKEEEYLAVAAKDMSISAAEVAGFPLAQVGPGRSLPLKAGVNPAHADAVAALTGAVIKPLLGDRTELSEADWAAVKAKLAGHEAWLAAKAGAAVEKLGIKRVREILGGKALTAIGGLLEQDLALATEANAIHDVEKLVRFHAHLFKLLNNFVNFSRFYAKADLAIFQAGRLYLDARACDLVVRVDDAGKHAALGGLAKTYLAYCDCTRPTGEKMTVAAAFTDGDSDNLMVGRNGLFYDRQGRDWDATITKIVENPISVREAFWSPYKKLVRLIEEQVAKRAAAADAEANAAVASSATAAANVDKAKPAEPKKIDVGTVAALGVAFGAIGGAIAAIAGYLSGVLKLPFWQVCLAFAGLILLISGPAMLIAWLKLRQRNLAPILDANGWAVNGRVKLNVPFGRSLTSLAKLPPGAQAGVDPYAQAPAFWPKLVMFGIVVAFVYSLLNSHGLIHRWTEGKWGDEKPKVSELEKLTKSLTDPGTNAAPAAK